MFPPWATVRPAFHLTTAGGPVASRQMSARSRPLSSLPVALTIAGSDCGAGAGVQADLLTFSALGVFGTTAITCLTAQNPDGVTGVHEVPVAMVTGQLRQIADFFALGAAKTGMLFSNDIIRAVAAFLRERPRLKLVVDPVMVATSGARLLQEDAIETMQRELIPLSTVATPNLDEAAVMLNGRRPANRDEAIAAARELATRFQVPVLLKGGHLAGNRLVDVLARPRGSPAVFTGRRVVGIDTHGSGCTLSAAIAALLARGLKLDDAVAGARTYLQRGLMRPLSVGGRKFIAHR